MDTSFRRRGFTLVELLVVIGHSHPKLNQSTQVVAWNVDQIGCGEGFSSLHPGGVQFALADGLMRFVAETINQFWFPNTLVDGTAANPDSEPPVTRVEKRVPVAYNHQTTLAAQVESGRNTLNFDLVSGGPIIQPDQLPESPE